MSDEAALILRWQENLPYFQVYRDRPSRDWKVHHQPPLTGKIQIYRFTLCILTALKLIQITDSLVKELVNFIAEETRKGTPSEEIAATVEILLDRETQKTIEEGLKSKGKVFHSYEKAETYLKGL